MTTTAERLAAALADRYRVERELGAGGMATVYLAEDLKHGRKVAIKVLHPELSAVLGGERFLAEIKLTAQLQHPHILGLIDSGTADGLLYYVMPFIEGETLRARLAREKQLPVDDAVRLAQEVASALEFAHKRGIVHRDVKPENVLLQDGQALVADFGIALAVQQAGGQRMTQTGLSLGTPSYMSPEQAMGERDIGPRSDVYALGAMTYEMLAGEPPFTGPSSQAIVAKVLTEAPPSLRAKRPMVPAAVEAAVLTALQKLPADRCGSAREFAEALAGTGRIAYPPTAALPAAPRPAARLGRLLPWAVAALALAAAGWSWRRSGGTAAAPPSTLALVTPVHVSNPAGGFRSIAISADGEQVAYTGVSEAGQLQVYLQRLDQQAPLRLEGTENGVDMLFAPDGRSLLFSKPAGGAPSRTAPDGSRPTPAIGLIASAYASYAPDGTLWASSEADGVVIHFGLDGRPKPLALPGARARLLMQQVLPDGRHALVVDVTSRASEGALALLDLASGDHRQILDHPVVEARYAAGYLVLVRNDGRLFAAAFDAPAGRITGPEVAIAEGVGLTGAGIAQFAVAHNGTVVYLPQEPSQLVLTDRRGAATPLLEERHNYHSPHFSPDGRRIALDFVTADGRDVWILDRAQGTLTRATSARDGHDPVWLRSGAGFRFTSLRSGAFGIYEQRLGGTSDSVIANEQLSWTGELVAPDGSFVTTAVDVRPGSGSDIVIVRPGGRLEPLLMSEFDEGWPALSPDGRWLAYTSNLSGQSEVYVRALTGDGPTVQVSLKGGSEPLWSRDGRELFYRAAGGGLGHFVAAQVRPGPELQVGSRTTLFAADDYEPATPHSNWDVSPDGRTFVLVRRTATNRMVVIQNLPELVRRRTISAR